MEHQSIEELDLEIKKLIAKKKKLQKIAFSSPLEQFQEVLIKYKYEPFFEIKEENNQYFLVGKGFEYSYKFNKDWGIKRIKNKIKSLIDPDGELSSETVFQIKNVIKNQNASTLREIQDLTTAGTECRHCVFPEGDFGKIKKKIYCKDILNGFKKEVGNG